jgi:linoleoyl-CoA desaturase
MLGSANISGSKAMHIMTGNLSHQIEHHLFPDMPSNRYGEIAPKIKDLFQRYGLSYTTGPLPKQVASAWYKVIRLSLPNRGEAKALARRPRTPRPATPVAATPTTRWKRTPAAAAPAPDLAPATAGS